MGARAQDIHTIRDITAILTSIRTPYYPGRVLSRYSHSLRDKTRQTLKSERLKIRGVKGPNMNLVRNLDKP